MNKNISSIGLLIDKSNIFWASKDDTHINVERSEYVVMKKGLIRRNRGVFTK
jgi:hypothetical protein